MSKKLWKSKTLLASVMEHIRPPCQSLDGLSCDEDRKNTATSWAIARWKRRQSKERSDSEDRGGIRVHRRAHSVSETAANLQNNLLCCSIGLYMCYFTDNWKQYSIQRPYVYFCTKYELWKKKIISKKSVCSVTHFLIMFTNDSAII